MDGWMDGWMDTSIVNSQNLTQQSFFLHCFEIGIGGREGTGDTCTSLLFHIENAFQQMMEDAQVHFHKHTLMYTFISTHSGTPLQPHTQVHRTQSSQGTQLSQGTQREGGREGGWVGGRERGREGEGG